MRHYLCTVLDVHGATDRHQLRPSARGGEAVPSCSSAEAPRFHSGLCFLDSSPREPQAARAAPQSSPALARTDEPGATREQLVDLII